MGRASELGTDPGWTFDAFLEYVESHRGATIYGGSSYGKSSVYLIGHYLNTYWDSLVDYSKKVAYFQTPEFIEFMLSVQEEEVKNAKSDWNYRFSSYLPALDYQFQTAL